MLVLEGTIWAQVGDERYTVVANHTVIIPPHTPHAWGNAGTGLPFCEGAFVGTLLTGREITSSALR